MGITILVVSMYTFMEMHWVNNMRTWFWWLLSLTFYYLGHIVSLMLRVNALAFMYPVYHWFMMRSLEISDAHGLDIWTKPETTHRSNT